MNGVFERDLTLRPGYPMAQNLRAKLPSTDKLIIHDVNEEVTASFVKEQPNTEIAKNVREVAEKSVRISYYTFLST